MGGDKGQTIHMFLDINLMFFALPKDGAERPKYLVCNSVIYNVLRHISVFCFIFALQTLDTAARREETFICFILKNRNISSIDNQKVKCPKNVISLKSEVFWMEKDI
ncbi:MAG: hypothetical protein E6767_19270 [Dysgonomonas sp.]|nr:hypothetical protein [Dysgonomonas sp.]